MELYRYNTETKEYAETFEPAAAPGDTFKLPNNCTDMKPPIAKEHEIVIFEPSIKNWIIKKDYRGLKGYDKLSKKEVEITEIGELPLYFVTELTPTFQEQRIQKIKDVKSSFTEALNKEVKINKIPCKVTFIQNIKEALDNTVTNLTSLDFINEGLTVTRNQANNILSQLELRELLLLNKKGKLIEQIKNTKTTEELKKVKISFCISKEFKALTGKSQEEIQRYINGEQN